MAPTSKDSTANGGRASRVSVSPETTAAGAKRGPPDEREPTRRVARRVEGGTNQDEMTNEGGHWKDDMEKALQNDLWSDDTEDAEEAMYSLAKNVYDDDGEIISEKQKYFFFLGGHAVVVRVMQAHPNDQNLQHNAICVLGIASYENQELSEAIMMVKGLEAILTAMKKYQSDADLQADGIAALFNLVHNSNEAMDLFVTKHDGIPFILGRMKKFSNNAKVIGEACDLLEILSKQAELRKSLVDAKAGSALMHAFECHTSNNRIQTHTWRAIKNLMEQSGE